MARENVPKALDGQGYDRHSFHESFHDGSARLGDFRSPNVIGRRNRCGPGDDDPDVAVQPVIGETGG
jgi:hypothetical protein